MNVPDFLQAIAQPAVPGRLCEAREPRFSGRYVQEAAADHRPGETEVKNGNSNDQELP